MWRVWLVVAVVIASCAGADAVPVASEESPPRPSVPSSTTTVPVPEEDGAMNAARLEPEPSFSASVREIDADDLGVSWREGCPVGVEELRWLDLSHWDDTASVAEGSLVVHADHVAAITTVFGHLFDARFPIHSMRPITEFAGDDNASMQANNTSAFNCREVDGAPGRWSQHAFGTAIDINPLVNPWVRGSRVDPPEGAAYTDRTLGVAGMVVAGDVVTRAFADIGWGWGGDWSGTVDYQHFSATGR